MCGASAMPRVIDHGITLRLGASTADGGEAEPEPFLYAPPAFYTPQVITDEVVDKGRVGQARRIPIAVRYPESTDGPRPVIIGYQDLLPH